MKYLSNLSSRTCLGWPFCLTFLSLLLVMGSRRMATGALVVIDSSFDQVLKVNALGGSVAQIGGGQPGKILLSSADFVGPAGSQSGVLVTLPDYLYAEAPDSFDQGSSTEPGNEAHLMLGVPTDVTFTKPGTGGPDGTAGDGSVQMKVPGGAITLWFGAVIVAPVGVVSDLLVFTDTAGGGTATFELLDEGGDVLASVGPVTAPGGSTASGTGGLLLDVTDGQSYAGIRVTLNSGAAEVDAVAANVVSAAVPEPMFAVAWSALTMGLLMIRPRCRA